MSPDPRRNGNAVASLVVAARIPAANQHQQLLRRIVPFPAESQATTALSFRRSIDPSRDEEYFYHYHPTTNDPHSDGFLADLARFLFALCKLVCWLSVSAVSYAIFYHCVMPSPHVVKELHFDYYYHPSSTTASTAIPAATTTPTTSSMPSAFFTRRDDLGDSPVLFHTDKEGDVAAALRVCTTTSDHSHTSPPLPTTMAMSEAAAAASASKTRPIPTASVDLLAVHNEWQAYFDDIVPTTKTQKQQSSSSLLAKQAYFIEIALHLPESPVNQNAGMFGVVAELYSASSTTPVSSSSGMEPTTGTGSSQDDDLLTKLAVSRRSYRFPYQSPWLSVVAKVLCLIPLLLGAIPESRTVAGQAFRHYIESSEHPLVSLNLSILLMLLSNVFSFCLLTRI